MRTASDPGCVTHNQDPERTILAASPLARRESDEAYTPKFTGPIDTFGFWLLMANSRPGGSS